jgi:hypothetical protein
MIVAKKVKDKPKNAKAKYSCMIWKVEFADGEGSLFDVIQLAASDIMNAVRGAAKVARERKYPKDLWVKSVTFLCYIDG